jgi:hypothetical protein
MVINQATPKNPSQLHIAGQACVRPFLEHGNVMVLKDVMRNAPGQEEIRERNLRIRNGTVTKEDWKSINNHANTVTKQGKSHIYLSATQAGVREKNFQALVEVVNAGTPVAVCRATGTGRCHSSTGSNGEAMQLHNKVYLAVGTRVMLSKNLAVPYKLVNGSFGILKQIVYRPSTAPPEQPMYVVVEFVSWCGPPWDIENPKHVPIVPVEAACMKHKRTCQRTQLPVDTCEAMSIHKVRLVLVLRVVDVWDIGSHGVVVLRW